MNQTTWLVQRAVLAVVLMVSFYALALGIAGFLLWIPYEAFTYDVRLPVKLMVVCLGFAGAILWAILPRFDRFVPPGPALAEHEATELFVVLRDIARATEQKMPVEVYLLNDVNAFVTHRGGLMGFGSRRVMGIGLPLLQSVTVQELRAILAHEFGHYNSGDVSIGPWIYKTRAAIVRTIQQIGDNALQTIFVAYGNWFLRLTQAVSRRQEFIADEIAARVAGSAAMMSALRKVHGGALAFHGYWNTEVGPVLNAGYLPPIAAGFTKFAEIESVRARIDDAVNSAEHVGQSDPYDTHPALGERIAALKALPPGSPGDVRQAVALLGDPVKWERSILAATVNPEWARSLTPVDWERVVDTVYVPLWRAAVRENSRLLRDVTPARLPFAGRFPEAPRELGDSERAALNQINVVSMALSLALYEAGWTATTSPGQEIVFRRGGHELRVFPELMAVATRKRSVQEWAARCVEMGIDGLAFAPVAQVK